jgi:hypothetical protein
LTGPGTAHFLLDEHVGWCPRQAGTPEYAAPLVDFATDLPYAQADRKLAAATAGTLAGGRRRRARGRPLARPACVERERNAVWMSGGEATGRPLGDVLIDRGWRQGSIFAVPKEAPIAFVTNVVGQPGAAERLSLSSPRKVRAREWCVVVTQTRDG